MRLDYYWQFEKKLTFALTSESFFFLEVIYPNLNKRVGKSPVIPLYPVPPVRLSSLKTTSFKYY
ncbi:hypothetical protein BpHYR1_001324 [Brachionus plicatilis]|uniref:Uncharacterized protein n=1 Tax=Brachionus plicatilis TaxID=10195 RepID=A0A3M7T7W7_BRAPC|nr:hypothetical protein BpHYR1_001324 [Brachionus plicatilis]